MFDGQQHNETDLLMKSILEGGQEEVPAHIWDGVSSELDRIAQRKKAVIFWRRAAIGISAAAALAFGVFLAHPAPEISDENIVAEIVEPVSEHEVSVVTEMPAEDNLTAMAPEAESIRPTTILSAVRNDGTTETAETTETTEIAEATETPGYDQTPEVIQPEGVTAAPATEGTGSTHNEETIAAEDSWIDDESEIKDRRANVSLVLSGITGTNSAQNTGKAGIVRRPTLSAAPVKTGITQTEAGDTYGIPLSFGAGVKIGFNSRWSLGVGLNYTLLSRKFYGEYTKVENGQITEPVRSNIRNTQHFVGIPVNAYYNIVENRFVNFYAYAGGAVEKCVTDEYRVLAKDIIHKEPVKGVQLSADLGIGVEFMLGKHLGIYLDPSLRYYFNCNQPKSIRTAQPLMLGFEMGLRARL